MRLFGGWRRLGSQAFCRANKPIPEVVADDFFGGGVVYALAAEF